MQARVALALEELLDLLVGEVLRHVDREGDRTDVIGVRRRRAADHDRGREGKRGRDGAKNGHLNNLGEFAP